jgi:Tol biopolymer transport system component
MMPFLCTIPAAFMAAAPPPGPDAISEGTASQWSAAAVGATASVSNDAVVVRVGSSSLRFDTDAPFDAWMTFPASQNAHWNFLAAGANGVGFWVTSVNPSPFDFQNSSPWIRLHTTPEDYIELHAVGELLNPSTTQWIFLFAPLAGNAQWTRTDVGRPSLTDINWVEIHADTWDAGFTLWIDGIQFKAPQPTSIAIAPSSPSAPVGVTTRLTATTTYDNGATQDSTTSCDWFFIFDELRTASVVGPGLILGTSEGSGTIVALQGEAVDSEIFTILPAPRIAPFEIISSTSEGVQANANNATSEFPDLSDDGRLVLFNSFASNLVAGDGNNASDVFLKDRLTGETELISVGLSGGAANGASTLGQISGDGRFVVFISKASDLDGQPTPPNGEIFIRDRELGGTYRLDFASLHPNEASYTPLNCGISKDGRFVCAMVQLLDAASQNLVPTVWRFDRLTGEYEVVSTDAAGSPSMVTATLFYSPISADGRYIAFVSPAALTAGATPGVSNAYRKDMETGAIDLVSPGVGGVPANGSTNFVTLDESGQIAFFRSAATNLIAPGATNTLADAYARVLPNGDTVRVSAAPDGSEANGSVGSLAISGDGRYLAFRSTASNLFEGDLNGVSDVFRVDRITGTRDVVTLAPWGLGDGNSAFGAALNGDGSAVAFVSAAGNLALYDTNNLIDTIVRSYPVDEPSDLDGDGVVSGPDLAILLGAWGASDPHADLDGDGVVGGSDLAILLGAWTS